MDTSENKNKLTFDQFKEWANREPSLDGAWIYELVRVFIDSDIKVPYPMFDISYKEERLFLSFEDAIRFIAKNKRDDIYCSWIMQKAIGERENEHGAVWLLDKNGNTIDYTTTHSFGEGSNALFYGRPAHRQRFKKGDIVEVVSRDKVKLAVLNSTVPDEKWYWEINPSRYSTTRLHNTN